MGVPRASHPCQYLFSVVLLVLAILTVMRWNINANYQLLIAKAGEHTLKFLLANFIFSY